MSFVTESYICLKSNKSACQWKSTIQLFFSPIKNYGEQRRDGCIHRLSSSLLWLILSSFMSSDIKEEAVDSRAEVKSFDHSKLKHVKTQEKVTLPGAGGLYS